MFRLLDCTFGLWNFWAFGLLDCGLLDFRHLDFGSFGLLDFGTSGRLDFLIVDFWTLELLGFRAFGLWDLGGFGLLDVLTSSTFRLWNFWTFRRLVFGLLDCWTFFCLLDPAPRPTFPFITKHVTRFDNTFLKIGRGGGSNMAGPAQKAQLKLQSS